MVCGTNLKADETFRDSSSRFKSPLATLHRLCKCQDDSSMRHQSHQMKHQDSSVGSRFGVHVVVTIPVLYSWMWPGMSLQPSNAPRASRCREHEMSPSQLHQVLERTSCSLAPEWNSSIKYPIQPCAPPVTKYRNRDYPSRSSVRGL